MKGLNKLFNTKEITFDYALLYEAFYIRTCILLIKRQPSLQLRPNKKISVFQVTGLKILGWVVTHIFFLFFCLEYNFMHFEKHYTFQNT